MIGYEQNGSRTTGCQQKQTKSNGLNWLSPNAYLEKAGDGSKQPCRKRGLWHMILCIVPLAMLNYSEETR